MEHLEAKTGHPFYEGSGAPSLFYVGTWNGVAHILRFGPEDQMYDVKKEADRIRAQWRQGNRIDNRGANSND